MEDLTKTQIVLLTLLVSFITSIATGIITTSLLAQAPQNITQTIDRVVERTVERVAPSTGTNAPATVREVTIVKEGDAIVGAVDSSTKSVVRIKSPAGSFYALGVVVSKLGLILSDKRDLSNAGTYTVVFSDGTTAGANLSAVSDTGSLVLFKITDDAKLKDLVPAVFSKADPKLGQTVIAVEGQDRTAVAVGRTLSLDASTGLASTDISAGSELQGGALLNLSGELVGLKTSNTDLTLPAGTYTVVSSLTRFISAHQ
ncbi:S1C family serine protease [Candidatus Parcubacteria bacterium]|nr:S1C family serine protease [Candidatus Parcubacteria bacterium]